MEHEFAARERKRDFLYFHFWPWCYRLFSKRPVQKKLAVLQMTASDRCRIICSVSTTNCAAAAIAVFYA